MPDYNLLITDDFVVRAALSDWRALSGLFEAVKNRLRVVYE